MIPHVLSRCFGIELGMVVQASVAEAGECQVEDSSGLQGIQRQPKQVSKTLLETQVKEKAEDAFQW